MIYYNTKETAKFVRVALKEAFPGTKFSVTTDLYSGGSAVRITCVDNSISRSEIESVVDKFESQKFDGMTDSTNYFSQTVNGEKVSYSGWIMVY
jgi:hypothetical protein